MLLLVLFEEDEEREGELRRSGAKVKAKVVAAASMMS